jgi:hypothetical protein
MEDRSFQACWPVNATRPTERRDISEFKREFVSINYNLADFRNLPLN